jgi:hypothetical protein
VLLVSIDYSDTFLSHVTLLLLGYAHFLPVFISSTKSQQKYLGVYAQPFQMTLFSFPQHALPSPAKL